MAFGKERFKIWQIVYNMLKYCISIHSAMFMVQKLRIVEFLFVMDRPLVSIYILLHFKTNKFTDH